jgi:hypothetical protein
MAWGRPRDIPQSAEAKTRIGAASRARWADPVWRAKMMAAQKREGLAIGHVRTIPKDKRARYVKLRDKVGVAAARKAMGI